MKLTITKEEHKQNASATVIMYFCNGVKIVTCRKYSDYYCTVKGGRPSNIRDKVKPAKTTSWNIDGIYSVLESLTKKKINRTLYNQLFKDDRPDTTWGYTGSLITPAKIKATITAYIEQFVPESENVFQLKKIFRGYTGTMSMIKLPKGDYKVINKGTIGEDIQFECYQEKYGHTSYSFLIKLAPYEQDVETLLIKITNKVNNPKLKLR